MPTTKRSFYEGVGYGIVAGVIFAAMEIVAAVAMGMPAAMPMRMFASVVWGGTAMSTASFGTVIFVGGIAHLALSAISGGIYGLGDALFSAHTRKSYGSQIVFGLLFGAAVWFVNFQIIARLAYPWFLDAPQGLQLAMHSLFFGLPLGVMYAAAERHATRVVVRRFSAS
jgi:hypothetical protein